jgi:hypothetical protein
MYFRRQKYNRLITLDNKSKASPVHAKIAYRSKGIPPLILNLLNLGTIDKWLTSRIGGQTR